MRRRLPVLIALVSSLAGMPARAQADPQNFPRALGQQVATRPSQILGVVRDELGQGLPGAVVLALGATLVSGRSDARGRFSMAVPAGDYILRAARDGYVSTYREAVRVVSDVPLHRTITMLKAGADDSVAVAPVTQTEPDPAVTRGGAVPSEATWRLRHLPRTVLRDEVPVWSTEPGDALDDTAPLSRDWRAMVADLTGSLDLVTTGSLALSQGSPMVFDAPSGVAYVAMGAPVGPHASWAVRAALTVEQVSAWAFLGEYRARSRNGRGAHAGVSYSAQTVTLDGGAPLRRSVPTDVLRAAAAYGGGDWAFPRDFTVSYQGRLEWFDYLANPSLVSGAATLRKGIAPHVAVFADVSRRMVAPGADQFAPPPAAGAWLPPGRTFSSLDTDQPIGAAEVDWAEFGLALGVRARDGEPPDRGIEVSVSRFVEQTSDQLATLFGLDTRSHLGHYYIGVAGSPRVDGLAVGVSGPLMPYVSGRIVYTMSTTRWSDAGYRASHGVLEKMVAATDARQGHDLTSTLEGRVPRLRTRVATAVRLNDWFASSSETRSGAGARFAIHAEQPLPLPAVGPDAVVLVVGARTLLSDLHDSRGYYDDLLTVAPPLRVTCGIQMRF